MNSLHYAKVLFTRSRTRNRRGLLLLAVIGLTSVSDGFGQSTFASVVGTVHDASGAVVANCLVTVENIGTSVRRNTITDEAGSYTVPNLEPGSYTVTMEAKGFQIIRNAGIELTARQTLRIDGQMKVATQSETVNVEAEVTTISTEVSNIAETKTGRELVDLPVAIATRSSGSTSPMSTLTTQPGVQTDPNGGISLVGTKPSMLSMSIDGISSIGPRTAGPLVELFPSFNAIAEIRVSEVNNSAEFGGVSDITTISKSGTNGFHGGLFENLQNTALTARNPFSSTVPKLHMNDFGFFLGGPISIPKLYHGRDKTFFFMGYEGLRLPRQQVLVESVPSLALRSGDLSVYSKPVYAPGSGTPYTNNQIPVTEISPVAQNALKYLFPLPNAGAPNAIANNYIQNFPTPISSDQGDMRIDQNINSKQTAFARFTYKKRDVTVAPSPGGSPSPTGSALLGPFSMPEVDFGLTVAYNYVLTPAVVNEVRGGFNGNHYATLFGTVPSQIVSQLGLIGIPQPYPQGNAVPNFNITGFQQTGGSASAIGKNNTAQILDNLTWTKGRHTLKFGGDYRRMTGYYGNVFASTRLGQFIYNGATTNLGVNGGTVSSTNPPYIGNPFAAFLLGVPDTTRLATVLEPDSSAYANHYAFFFQDDLKVTPRLTLNIGLRWEYHPMFQDHFLNVTNFLPDYTSIVNGQAVNGAIVIPNQASFAILNPDFAKSVAPTPILTAAQAGIPESLRYSQKTDFAPRFGFAWRPFANGKTVIRGGYGRFIEGPLGSLLSAAWGVHTTNYGVYGNKIVNGNAVLRFPYPFPSDLAQPGIQDFEQAGDTHYKDPVVHEWNFTVERDLGFGTGVRVSYNGSYINNLGVQVNYDQLPANTIGYAAAKSMAPFPLWARINAEINGGIANYNALTLAASKRFSKGLQFQSSYTFAKNLSSGQSYNPTSFATEAGGQVTDLRNIGLDYGNVAFTRRNRFLSTFLYQLPFGHEGFLLKNAHGVVDRVIGGWQLAGVLLFQSGPFMTATVPGADPSGTGFSTIIANGRPDMASGVSLYPAHQTLTNYLNPAAFVVPQNNIGRFGNAPVGNIVGPGTQAVSLSLMKTVPIKEQLRVQVGAQVANALNHPNYAPPNTTFNTAAFGTISNVQSAEGAGPRAIQITARLNF